MRVLVGYPQQSEYCHYTAAVPHSESSAVDMFSVFLGDFWNNNHANCKPTITLKSSSIRRRLCRLLLSALEPAILGSLFAESNVRGRNLVPVDLGSQIGMLKAQPVFAGSVTLVVITVSVTPDCYFPHVSVALSETCSWYSVAGSEDFCCGLIAFCICFSKPSKVFPLFALLVSNALTWFVF